MTITIDTEACKKLNIDPAVALYLISIAVGHKITFKTFEKARKEYLLEFSQPYEDKYPFPEYVSLNGNSKYILETLIAESRIMKDKDSEERITNLANKLREIFPEGKKAGYAYTWRDSTSCIADRLKKFFLKYGEHTDEEIIDATKRYVMSFNGDYRYMQLLKYFIWKNKVTGGELIEGRLVGEVEKQSQLAAYIENKNESSPTFTNDWDLTLK